MDYRASRISRVVLDANRTIALGTTITVFGFIVANSSASPAEVTIIDGDETQVLTITVPAKDSKIVHIEWIADNGLIIDGIGSNEVFVTVYHSQSGS